MITSWSLFGFSPDKAARISKPITHLKMPDKTDAARRCHYLNHQVFSEPGIKKLITWCPQILCSSPENTINPNLRALHNMGVSTSSLTLLFTSAVANSDHCEKLVGSILSISPASVVLVCVVQVVAYWKVYRKMQRDMRALASCVQELRMKESSFDLLRSHKLQRG